MGCFYRQGLMDPAKSPLEWRRQALVLVATLGLPLTVFSLAGALLHFILGDRFNRSLLFDLVARPAEKSIVGMSEAA